MCTLTYLPLSDDSFVMTHNRDEDPARNTSGLHREQIQGQLVVFPRDVAGGTWVAMSDRQRLAFVLNGAYERHERTPPYRLSRGRMLLDYYQYGSSFDFADHYQFAGIEPFTLVIKEPDGLTDIRWDGTVLRCRDLNQYQPHIWSSPTLYDAHMRRERAEWFDAWYTESAHSRDSILDFHQHGGDPSVYHRLVMNYQDRVRTVSVTSVACNAREGSMRYLNLLTNEEVEDQIDLTTDTSDD